MRNKNTRFIVYLICVLFFSNLFIWYAVLKEDREGILTVYFFDVGQGDAIFIDTPNGNQILLDGGPDKKVLREIGKSMPFYDRSIDLLALSHPHSDHLSGLLNVFPRYNVFGFLSSGTQVKTSEYFILKKEFLGKVKDVIARSGMIADFGGGVFLEVLYPAGDVSSSSPHDGMLVARLVYGKTSFLLMGDTENGLEKYLLSVNKQNLKSNVLKVAHHGSKTSTSEFFVSAVSPKYAVISSGKNNKYGHPSEKTLDVLNKFDVKILRTDVLGTIVIKSDGEKVYTNLTD